MNVALIKKATRVVAFFIGVVVIYLLVSLVKISKPHHQVECHYVANSRSSHLSSPSFRGVPHGWNFFCVLMYRFKEKQKLTINYMNPHKNVVIEMFEIKMERKS